MEALPDHALTRLFVLHPDPWPKTRHHKRRMISPWFFAEAARLHPLVFIVPPLVGWAVLRPVLAAFDVIPDDFRPLRRLPGWAWALLAAAMFVLWGLRLAGFCGGHPDPVDLTAGVLSRHLLF